MLIGWFLRGIVVVLFDLKYLNFLHTTVAEKLRRNF
jgi:hypothetical protein